MSLLIAVGEAYDTGAFPYSYSRSLAYDVTDMLTFTPDKDFKTMMLFDVMYRTYRNFQEPALRFFKIKGRSKLIRIIRNTNLNAFEYIMYFKITEGRFPTSEKELETFLTNHDTNNDWGKPYFWRNDFNSVLEELEQIAGLLKETSVYEWISLYCNDDNNNLNWLIQDIKTYCERLNWTNQTNVYGIKDVFNIQVTTHEALLNKLIAANDRPAP